MTADARAAIATSGALTGLAALIPVPFLDEALVREARARLVLALVALRGRDGAALRPRLRPLWAGDGCLAGCLWLPRRLLLEPLEKLLRTLFFVLGLRGAALEVGRTLALGRAVERCLGAGKLEDAPVAPGGPDPLPLEARRVRAALDAACAGIDRVALARAFDAAVRGLRALPGLRRVLRSRTPDDAAAIAALPPGERAAVAGAVDRRQALLDDPSLEALLEELERRFDAALAAPRDAVSQADPHDSQNGAVLGFILGAGLFAGGLAAGWPWLTVLGGVWSVVALSALLGGGRSAWAAWPVLRASTGAPDLAPTSLELVRRRLRRGEAGPGRTPDEQVVRGLLGRERVSVRARLGLEESRPLVARCRVEAVIPDQHVGALRPGPHGPELEGRPAPCDADAARAALSHAEEVRVDREGIELNTRETGADELMDALDDLLGLAARLRADAPPPGGLRVTRRRAPTDARCPYCLAGFAGDDELVACDACQTPQHRLCFEDHGRCSVHACAGQRARPRRERA